MGDCLKTTYEYLEKCLSSNREDRNDFLILHSIVERPIDGLRHPHSVIYNKKTRNIHEVSNEFKKKNVIIPLDIWIKMGKVSNIKQYTFEEYTENLIKYKVWDFWDL